jgi:hypothetical protein
VADKLDVIDGLARVSTLSLDAFVGGASVRAQPVFKNARPCKLLAVLEASVLCEFKLERLRIVSATPCEYCQALSYLNLALVHVLVNEHLKAGSLLTEPPNLRVLEEGVGTPPVLAQGVGALELTERLPPR